MSLSRASTFLTALAVAAGLAAPPEARAATPIKHPAQVASPLKVDVSPPLRTITPILTLPVDKKAPENPPLPKQGRTYRSVVKNERSRGKSLVTTLVLDGERN